MALKQITDSDLEGKGVLGQPDVPGLSAAEMQAKIEQLPREVIIPALNENAENTYSKAEVDFAIDVKMQNIGAGDMAKSTYDPQNGARQVAFQDAALDVESYRGSAAGVVKDADKLGGQLPACYRFGPNLLDNSDFTNPVNQRGTAAYYTAGYTIDRWILNAGALNVAGRYIAGGLADGTVYLYQPLLIPKLLGKVLTAAARINGADYALTLDTSKSHTEQTNQVAFAGGRLECSWNTTTGMFYFRITSLTSAAVVIDWAKLEVGSVATPYVSKGYGAELAECMRYYQRFTDMNLSGIVYCTNGDTRGMGFVLPVPMRIAPSVSNAVAADGFAFVVSDTRSDINQSISSKSFETNQGFVTVRNLQFTNAGLYGGVATIALKFTLVELSAEL